MCDYQSDDKLSVQWPFWISPPTHLAQAEEMDVLPIMTQKSGVSGHLQKINFLYSF